MSTEKVPLIVTPGPIQMCAQVGSPTIVMRAYYSSYHLAAATLFVKQVVQIERAPGTIPRFDILQRSNVTGAILSAVGFLEAGVNEICKDVFDDHAGYIGPIPAEARTKIREFWEEAEGAKRKKFYSVLSKCQKVLEFCGKKQFDENGELYRHASLAVKLRNELTHYKPASFSTTDLSEFQAELVDKFAMNPLSVGTGNPFFPDKCLGSPCARWVLESVRAFAGEFFNRIGVEPNYRRVKFHETV